MKERFLKVRKDNRLSQADFGNKIGVTGAAISRIESGDREPSDVVIKAICREFGIRREWLEFGHEPMKAAEMENSPETLVPELVAILQDNPALLALARRTVDLMTPADWKRLNQLLDELFETKKEPPQP